MIEEAEEEEHDDSVIIIVDDDDVMVDKLRIITFGCLSDWFFGRLLFVRSTHSVCL